MNIKMILEKAVSSQLCSFLEKNYFCKDLDHFFHLKNISKLRHMISLTNVEK